MRIELLQQFLTTTLRLSLVALVFLGMIYGLALNLTRGQLITGVQAYASSLSSPISAPISSPISAPLTPTPISGPISAPVGPINRPILTRSPSVVAAGGTVTVNWGGISNAAVKDWISLVDRRTGQRKHWFFINSCSKSVPSVARTSGTCNIDLFSTLTPGEYELKLYANNSFYDLLNLSDPFTVTSAPSTVVSALVAPASIQSGNNVTVSWSNLTQPMVKDWVGLYKVGAQDTDYKHWIFLGNCARLAAVTPALSGSCSLALPSNLSAGQFEVRVFKNNTFYRLGTSNPFSVTD